MEDSPESSPEIHLKMESCWPEILKRVPTKQLGICMCVSKKWNSLITSPSFISSHTIFLSKFHLITQASNLFLLRSFSTENPRKPSKELYHICSDSEIPNKNHQTLESLETLIKKTVICPFKTRGGFQFRFVGSVNGVVFLSDDYLGNTYNFILWNPLLSCFIHLPKPRTCFDTIGPYMHASGLGYDSESDDFKVIRVVYPSGREGLDETPPRAELYSVNEGKWRWVSAENVEYCTTDKEWSQCFVRGSVHWVAYERRSEEEGRGHKSTLLLLFNVVKEKFQMMKLPLELRDVCPLAIIVSESRGLLCVNHYVKAEMLVGEVMEYNLWVKKEYNRGGSWCKIANIDLSGRLQKAVHWRMNGELLIWSIDKELVSYDIETGNGMILAPKDDHTLYDACSFVESLAFLNKDCKNRRRYVPEEADDENGSSDDNEALVTPERARFHGAGRFFFCLYQMQKFRRQF